MKTHQLYTNFRQYKQFFLPFKKPEFSLRLILWRIHFYFWNKPTYIGYPTLVHILCFVMCAISWINLSNRKWWHLSEIMTLSETSTISETHFKSFIVDRGIHLEPCYLKSSPVNWSMSVFSSSFRSIFWSFF